MIKNSSYQEKFQWIQPWLISIIDIVKKDLKNEHLRIDKAFCKKYFLAKSPNQLQAEEMAIAYEKDIAEGNVGLGEFIASRWLLKNTDVYGFFEEELKHVLHEFDQITELTQEHSMRLIQKATAQFGAVKTYIFSVFNEVVFTQEAFATLKTTAEKESHTRKLETAEKDVALNLDHLKKKHAREIAAITDRFEKKLSGLQKKYLNDIEILKKQIALLQRKLSERAVNES